MSVPTEGLNPLRPYYVPPSITSSAGPGEISSPVGYRSQNVSSPVSTSRSLGFSARNILADMDYSEYLSDTSPSAGAIGRNLVEHAIWKYTSIFLAQPFDVAKIVLQARRGQNEQGSIRNTFSGDARKPPRKYQRDLYEVCSQAPYIMASVP